MKLYNPFKAHIVQTTDKYFVRRLDFPTPVWIYKSSVGLHLLLDKKPNWWFSWEYVVKYCPCDTLEQARILRDKQWVDPNKTPKLKVIHG